MSHTYRTRSSLKLFLVAFTALSLFFCVVSWRGVLAGTHGWLEVVISVVLALVGTGFGIQTFTQQIELSGDSIRYGNIFESRSLRLDQIRHRFEYEDSSGETTTSYLKLVAHDGAAQSIQISKDDFDLDNAFWYWMRQIPDLEDLSEASTRT